MKKPKAKPDRTSASTDQYDAPPTEATEQKGYVLIRDLCQNEMDSVHSMRVVNTDAKTHSVKTPEKCQQEAEKGENGCIWMHDSSSACTSPPFVASVDGILGVEATTTLKILASLLSTKWQKPYSRTCGYIKSRIAITLVSATHRCIRGSRFLAHRISVQRPQREDNSGMNLFR